MIGRLEGQLHQVGPGEVIVDAGGIGWLVRIGLRTFEGLTGKTTAVLWTHTLVRSDEITLYGFPDRDELEMFQRLIAIAGVGPRTALALLSGMSPGELAEAVEGGDARRLQRVPGVGRKTAERILLELRGRIPVAGAPAPASGDATGDAISALINLGYAARESERAVRAAATECSGAALPELLRVALRRLNEAS
ncbi:MAG TPA: Holliday junction branch migration protein RuvA [Acidobacteria bacterium]|nr:Holliday junction branch migration protein RuvA [Acidobacteriota bacterium]